MKQSREAIEAPLEVARTEIIRLQDQLRLCKEQLMNQSVLSTNTSLRYFVSQIPDIR